MPDSMLAAGAVSTPFRNFTQMPSYLPAWAWRILRGASMAGAVAIALWLMYKPEQGLPLFWGLLIPALPLLFMLLPGFWRNVCPLASSNQMPRRLGLTKHRAQKALPTGAAYPFGIAVFIIAIIARKLFMNTSGVATGLLILGAMGFAFAGGLLFKGKSGWCSSICPLLPVQRLYGQTPFVKVANTQCEPCVGCAKNCYDFSPEQAYLADQYDSDPHYREFRRFFAGVFPGLVLGFYLAPPIAEAGAVHTVAQMLLYMAASFSVFMLLDLLMKGTPNRMPVISAAVAINAYYWFVAPVVLQTLSHMGMPNDLAFVGALRCAVAIMSIVWIVRSVRMEKLFLKEQVRMGKEGEIALAPVVVQTVRVHRHLVKRREVEDAAVAEADDSRAANAARIEGGDTAPGALASAEAAPAAIATQSAVPGQAKRRELRIEPEGRVVPIKTGASLLDTLEGCGADIKAGCRAGACGGDPIAVTGGEECLGPIGDAERATLARLGHAPNTRLACMARARKPGTVCVELKPHAAGSMPAATPLATAPSRTSAAADTTALPLQTSSIASMTALPPRTSTAADTTVLPGHVPAVAANGLKADPSVRRVVIIGNGVAGLTAAETVRRLHGECEIHLVSRERHASYNRIAVSSLVNERSGLQGLGLRPEGWYAEQRVVQWLNTRAVRIDVEGRRVGLATGEQLEYDKLVLGNGSQAWVPPMQGFGAPGSFALRDADDAMAMRDYAQHHAARAAVVMGAGLLGLEAAAELRKFGMQVRVLALGDRVLDRQIDASASRLVVQHIASLGIELVADAKVARLSPRDGRLHAVELEDGRVLDADLFVACAGTRADTALAREAGIACGRGITVDASMHTSAPHVYAAGDVAEFDGQQFGLWSIAASQGEVAARSALGLPAFYEPIEPSTALKLQGIEVRSCGRAEAQEAGQRELLFTGFASVDSVESEEGEADEGPAYCKLVVQERSQPLGGDSIVGAVIVGAMDAADDLLDAARRGASLASIEEVLATCRWQPGARASASRPPRLVASKVVVQPSHGSSAPETATEREPELLARAG